MNLRFQTYLAALSLILVVGCAHAKIEGTNILDTDENRQLLDVLEQLKIAMEIRDSDAVMVLVSSKYFEDMGTPDTRDDYGYIELQNRIMPQALSVAKEYYINFEVHEVVVEGERAYADVRFTSRARLEFPSGSRWDTHRDFNRVEFALENEQWRIIRGL